MESSDADQSRKNPGNEDEGTREAPPKTTKDATLDSIMSSRMSGNARRTRAEEAPDERPMTTYTTSSELEEQLTNDSLNRLQKMFAEADEDCGGGLDIDEFTNAMRKIMPGLPERELQLIFMKVDTNCDGTVDWDEYISYMLLEYKEKDQMMSQALDTPFPKPLRYISSSHRDDITGICFLPSLTRNDHWVGIDHLHGRYITVSNEGIVEFWTQDLTHQKTHVLSHIRQKTVWITAMVAMPNVNKLAIASTEREISIFDINANKFDRQYRITGLEDSAMSMDYWFNKRNANEAVLVWGDIAGSICAIVFSECNSSGSLFGRHSIMRNGRRIVFPELLRGKMSCIQAYRLVNMHDDWVCQVRYYHSLNCFISCSVSQRTSMYMGSFVRKKTSSYFQARKGILCFDYSEVNNVIVTGGVDHLVRMWNPYVTSNSIVSYRGHVHAVVHVIINQTRDQIISIAKDKSIRIFNMADQSCAQYIPAQKISMGKHVINTALFNPYTQSLILGTNQLAVLEKGDEHQDEVTSHNAPICAALYNKVFGQVVSACSESKVCVWSIRTGQKLIQFSNAHFTVVAGQIVPIEITAMSFDPTERRLITGARDGTVKIWNFNNGACLRELKTHGGEEITGIVCPKDRIVVVGWNRRVSVYMDVKNLDDDVPRLWSARHEEDIHGVAFNGTTNIATSSYDGDIIVWNLETGHPLCKMNAYTSASLLTSTNQIKTDFSYMNSPMHVINQTDVLMVANTRSPRRKVQTANMVREVDSEDGRETVSAESHSENSRRSAQNEKWQRSCDYNQTSVDELVFLTKREPDEETATILSGGADGWIRAWSVHHKGGLRAQFVGVHYPGASIAVLVVGKNDEILISGDTDGYVKVWDINDYCISGDQLNRLIPPYHRQKRTQERRDSFYFPIFSRILKTVSKFRFDCKRFAKPPETSDPDRTIQEPFLLNSFRAHLKPITHIDILDDRGLMITSSADRTVRMWTMTGRYIGVFGQTKPWDIGWEAKVNTSSLPMIAPTDVTRVASASTMQILKPGFKDNWSLARNIVLLSTKLRLKNKEGIGELQEMNQDPLPSTSGDQGEPILGKHYTPRVRHKKMPKLPPIKHDQSTVSVFSSLPFSELDPVEPDPCVSRIVLGHKEPYRSSETDPNRQARSKLAPKNRPVC